MRFDVIANGISGSEKYCVYGRRVIMTRREILKNMAMSSGIFIYWKIQNRVAEDKQIQNNQMDISIVHCNDNNWVRKNAITNWGECEILFREERERFTATGNKIEENIIKNIKLKNGTGISIQGLTQGNEICKNEILEDGEKNEKVGIRIAKTAQNNFIKNNKIKGFAKDIMID